MSTYPVVDVIDEYGNAIPHYRIEVEGTAVLLISVANADADPSLIQREIDSLLGPSNA